MLHNVKLFLSWKMSTYSNDTSANCFEIPFNLQSVSEKGSYEIITRWNYRQSSGMDNDFNSFVAGNFCLLKALEFSGFFYSFDTENF